MEGHGLQFKGLKKSKRVLEMLDLAVLGYLGGGAAAREALQQGPTHVRQCCRELFTDVSQNPDRRCYTASSEGVSRCLTSSTLLYSHARPYDFTG